MPGSLRWTVVENRWPSIIRGLETKADQIVRKAAMDIEARAKMLSPVDTGVLRSSIQATAVGPRHWRVTVGADYGVYVEYGTRYNRPQPFLDPAVQQVWPSFQAAMRRTLV